MFHRVYAGAHTRNHPLNTDGSRIGNLGRVSLGMWRDPRFVAFPFVWVPQQIVLHNCTHSLRKGTFHFCFLVAFFWGVNSGFLISRDLINYCTYLLGEKRYSTYFLNYISLLIKEILKLYMKINKIAFIKESTKQTQNCQNIPS